MRRQWIYQLGMMLLVASTACAQDECMGESRAPVESANGFKLSPKQRKLAVPQARSNEPQRWDARQDSALGIGLENDNAKNDRESAKAELAERSELLQAAQKPLDSIDFGSVFEKMPNAPPRSRRASVNSGWSSRDPYYGSSQKFTYTWAARNLAHRTLYFEEMPLERYGQTCNECVQPVKSGARFLADAITLPLQLIHERPCDLHYVLGLERPGTCACPTNQKIVPYTGPRKCKHCMK